MAVSQDGKRVAATVRDQTTSMRDIWLFDAARNLGTRFTFDPANETSPFFSPDGNWLAYSSNRKGHDDIYRKAVSGSADEELLVESKEDKNPFAWSPDGRYLAYFQTAKGTRADISVLPMEGERKPQVFLQTPFLEYPAAFSPDGRWLAYGSDESGSFQIYVTSFPKPGRKWQVSTESSAYAYWSADGKEIVSHAYTGQVWAVEVAEKADSLEIGAPKPLFKLPGPPRPSGTDFFPTADHQRFLILDHGQKANTLLNLVVNWPAAARR
jgi:Tol biopolymer transport system component